MQTVTVGPNPGTDAVRFGRSEEFLAWIESDGKRIGAIVFGTRSRPYKVNIDGQARGKFATWDEAVASVTR